jgi:hypothetical protein
MKPENQQCSSLTLVDNFGPDLLRILRRAVMVLPLVLVPIAALGSTILPPAVGSVTLFSSSNPMITYNGIGPGLSYQLTGSAGTAFGTIDVTTDPLFGLDPSLSATSISSGAQVSSLSQMLYGFVVNGPANQTVPVMIGAEGWASVSGIGSGQAISQLFFFDGTNTLASELICLGNCQGGPTPFSTFDLNQRFDLDTNTLYLFRLGAAANASSNGSASAYVDPTVTLLTNDPAYSLEFSSGLLPATPEPSSLFLVGTGMLTAVGTLRRRIAAR